eukprot:gene4813-5444_t
MATTRTVSTTRLFVARLPWIACKDSLWSHFRQFGPLKDTKVALDLNTGRSKKFGFVTFKSSEDAQKAVESAPHFIDGKEISAVFSDPSVKTLWISILATFEFISVCHADQCPSRWGTLTPGSVLFPTDGTYNIVMILIDLKFTCYGRITNWHVSPQSQGSIQIGIVRPIPGSGNYKVVFMDEYSVQANWESFTFPVSIDSAFAPKDSVAVIAAKNMFPRYENTSEIVIFHKVIYTSDILQENTKEKTTGQLRIAADIEGGDYRLLGYACLLLIDCLSIA